jgi:hypothetical protein
LRIVPQKTFLYLAKGPFRLLPEEQANLQQLSCRTGPRSPATVPLKHNMTTPDPDFEVKAKDIPDL